MKKKQKITLGTLLFLLFGTICIIVVGIIEKWDLRYLLSPTAYLIYAIIVLVALFLGYWLIKIKLSGGDDE